MLEIRNIRKTYGNKVALKCLNFELHAGIYGLLGPNGAGKSTLMHVLTDNLLPDEGEVLWKNKRIWEWGVDYRRILGFAPQQQGLYEEFTGRRFLKYMGTLKEIPAKELSAEAERAASLVNLQEVLDKRPGTYSGGMKQRILIAQALMGDPRLLILDEPTAGLDPRERVRIRELLDRISEDRIILAATHVVSDIETIADQVILLREGELVAKDRPAELISRYAPGESLEEVYLAVFGEE